MAFPIKSILGFMFGFAWDFFNKLEEQKSSLSFHKF